MSTVAYSQIILLEFVASQMQQSTQVMLLGLNYPSLLLSVPDIMVPFGSKVSSSQHETTQLVLLTVRYWLNGQLEMHLVLVESISLPPVAPPSVSCLQSLMQFERLQVKQYLSVSSNGHVTTQFPR
ncbi:Hypothetical_protein [Hexamita inflata]|uniref:Hypothetical_protein n=1 Tax=Hexamita inflata TaxID=28002 RepID=A0AA86NIG9_9EUKA|nr:Hypothetical protein HINF_LOCUS7543 [Hexamita inflata]